MLFAKTTPSKPTISERLDFRVDIDGTEWLRHKQDVTTILKNSGQSVPTSVYEDDTVKLTYAFDINYYGDVEQTLRAFGRILQDPDVVVSAEVTELFRGECIIQSVLEAFRDVKNIIAERSNKVSDLGED